MSNFSGYHSEWNLGSPGGWDYQRLTQRIGKAVWQKLDRILGFSVELDFDHPLFSPVDAFSRLLVDCHRAREGRNPGIIAVVAEEETLEDVTENRNLARLLNTVDGITGVLAGPREIELRSGRVCWRAKPVSIIFMDFNTDVLLSLHRRHGLDPLLQAVAEHRVINPRGTEPFNAKSMFEVLTTPGNERFHADVVARTPWTRRFYQRRTEGPFGEAVSDLVDWTRTNWERLVLKPERGYSGHGVRVGGVNQDADEAIELALEEGHYIVQEKIPLDLWAEEIPVSTDGRVHLQSVQTDFRCLMGPGGLLGFVGRYGGVPTNVGSGGGFQPLAVLRSSMKVSEAVAHLNRAILRLDAGQLEPVLAAQEKMAMDCAFTYLLGPVKIALRPRIITGGQIEALEAHGRHLWADCLTLEKMWLAGELDHLLDMDPEEVRIARMDPWEGSPAIIASDGLFDFGGKPDKR